MINEMIKRVNELKIEPDEKADMLAEMVEELNKPREYKDDNHKEQYLWSCMWGARYKSKQLLWPVDKPTTRGSAVVLCFDDLATLYDNSDLAVNDVRETIDYNDCYEQLARAVKDIVDVRIIEGKLEGLNNREVAERIGVSEKTVWVRVEELKKRFKSLTR